jgi:hypothetical protein
MSIIQGVDSSVTSVTTTLTPDNFTANPAETPKDASLDGPDPIYAGRMAVRLGATASVLNANVIPNLRVLLGETLRAINASIPNKEQNRSVTEIIREAFDRAYFDIYGRAFPDCTYGQSGGYALTPEPNRAKAFSDCLSTEK